MRFIFDYVTCCMMSSPCDNNNEGSSSSHPPSRAEDETRSLVTPARSGRRRKRTAVRGTSAEWQPSLFAIAEDNAAVVSPAVKVLEKVDRPKVTATVKQPSSSSSSQRNVKRCGTTSSSRVGSTSRSYDFSHDPIPMAIPTFSAAPFMF